MNVEKFIGEIKMCLKDSRMPIQATQNWAIRDSSISTGTSGLELAMNESFGLVGDEAVKLKSECQTIFASIAEFDTSKNLEVAPSSHEPHTETLALGDVFTGYCGRVWLDIVLGQVPAFTDHNTNSGAVTRPGIGHGDLIRDFVLWFEGAYQNSKPFVSAEDSFERAGWCYGSSGFLTILSLVNKFGKPTSRQSALLYEAPSLLLAEAKAECDEAELGLCHGISGILVVALGIARILNNERDIELIKDFFYDWVESPELFRIHPDSYVDASWLTGVAGLVWTESVMRKTPTINPLFPLDSKCYQ